MAQILANNVTGVLSGAATATATSLPLVSLTGWPVLAAGDFHLATLIGLNSSGVEAVWEVVKVTGRVGSALTVVRAQEGTKGVAWPAGTVLQMRLTAASVATPTLVDAVRVALEQLITSASQSLQSNIDGKVDLVPGKGLSENDLTAALLAKLNGIAAGAQVNVATNLGQGTRTTTTLPLTSSTGSGTTLPAATTALAGLMVSTDKAKLDGIAAGAQVNVPTNLKATAAAVNILIESSTGDNATLPLATSALAGLMAPGDVAKLAGIAAGAQVNVATNLGIGTRTATGVPVTSSTGTSTTFPVASTTLAGAMSAADKSKLDAIAAGATVNWTSTLIPDSADLNTYQTEGSYYCPNNAWAVTLANCPTKIAFNLSVWRAAGVVQRLTEYINTTARKTYERSYYSNVWSGWSRVYTEIDPPALATTAAPGLMSSDDKSKLDGVAAGAQVNVGTDLDIGTRTTTTVPLTSSTGNNTTLPAATTALAGVMTSTDKAKLDAIAAAATKNDTDANLKSRANHTGTQAISTVTGLQAALDAKVAVGEALYPKFGTAGTQIITMRFGYANEADCRWATAMFGAKGESFTFNYYDGPGVYKSTPLLITPTLLQVNTNAAFNNGSAETQIYAGAYNGYLFGNSGSMGFYHAPSGGQAVLRASDGKLFSTRGFSGPVTNDLATSAVSQGADLGNSFVAWEGAATPVIQIDAPINTAAYMIWRATKWGERHLAAMHVHASNSSTAPAIVTLQISGQGGTVNPFVWDGNGDYHVRRNIYANNALVQTSDIRLKNVIEDIETPLDKLEKVRVIKYTRKDLDSRPQISYSAQSVQDQFPENTVLTEAREDQKAFIPDDMVIHVDQGGMNAVNTAAIQQLYAIVKRQQRTIDILKKRG
ncbi:pyocin knob domain-containing S74 family peptidase [Comamonas thiooxydans]|uniref:pyocin knob domain-containing S74 family peptidase n=1 Tax=Comamonas thiooxydans TaxID=363952 RepID=UPI001CCEA539|nr:pyocin knob domain-containing S74 family peptidase [Comamonas thiooxydans]UBQ44578.1 pyocin knob domain-containing S74 family peptidase [Comamonas thiooxydans]